LVGTCRALRVLEGERQHERSDVNRRRFFDVCAAPRSDTFVLYGSLRAVYCRVYARFGSGAWFATQFPSHRLPPRTTPVLRCAVFRAVVCAYCLQPLLLRPRTLSPPRLPRSPRTHLYPQHTSPLIFAKLDGCRICPAVLPLAFAGSSSLLYSGALTHAGWGISAVAVLPPRLAGFPGFVLGCSPLQSVLSGLFIRLNLVPLARGSTVRLRARFSGDAVDPWLRRFAERLLSLFCRGRFAQLQRLAGVYACSAACGHVSSCWVLSAPSAYQTRQRYLGRRQPTRAALRQRRRILSLTRCGCGSVDVGRYENMFGVDRHSDDMVNWRSAAGGWRRRAGAREHL